MIYLLKTVSAGRFGGFDVHGFIAGPKGELQVQMLKQFIDTFPTMDAALAAHPSAKAGYAE